MNKENKFLNRSRERARWKNKLSAHRKNEAKADSIYFRPTVSDDKRIRELASLMGETNNSIVEKLVHSALHNKTLTTAKIEEQKTALRRLEDKTDDVLSNQVEILILLDEIRRTQTSQEKLNTSLLSEIYCMAHTAVSLLRTALLQILGLTQKTAPFETQVLDSFDETSNLTIARSIQDLESTAAHHQITSGKIQSENLFWKSKLRQKETNSQTE